MNKEQMEVLNSVQEVMRGVVIAMGAIAPEKLEAFAAALGAFSEHPGISPTARLMLKDLAEGPAQIAGLRGSIY